MVKTLFSEGRILVSRRVPLEEVLETDCKHIFDLWDSLRGDRFAPSWREFDLKLLPPQVISFSRVLDVHHDPFDLIYRFWGTGLVNLLGEERTGKSLVHYQAVRVPQVVAEFETVIQERAPCCFIYDAKTSKVTTPLYSPAIRVPLSDDGDAVHNVLAYTDFQTDHDRWQQAFKGEPE